MFAWYLIWQHMMYFIHHSNSLFTETHISTTDPLQTSGALTARSDQRLSLEKCKLFNNFTVVNRPGQLSWSNNFFYFMTLLVRGGLRRRSRPSLDEVLIFSAFFSPLQQLRVEMRCPFIFISFKMEIMLGGIKKGLKHKGRLSGHS